MENSLRMVGKRGENRAVETQGERVSLLVGSLSWQFWYFCTVQKLSCRTDQCLLPVSHLAVFCGGFLSDMLLFIQRTPFRTCVLLV